VKKHASILTSLELLAVAANMLGKLVALQDQRKVSPLMAMEIVTINIECGNQQAIEELRLGMGHFPNETPHLHANRIAAKDPDDKGSLFIIGLDQNRVQIIARSPGEAHESRVCVPKDEWLKLIANWR
jgi:hypothetical protein